MSVYEDILEASLDTIAPNVALGRLCQDIICSLEVGSKDQAEYERALTVTAAELRKSDSMLFNRIFLCGLAWLAEGHKTIENGDMVS